MSTSTGKPVSHRGLAALLASLSAVGPFSVDAYLPSMGEIGQALQASPVAVQQTLTAYMLPFAIMTLWHGALSDALGRRRVVLWGMALFGLASLACVFAQSIEALMVFRALQGMSSGAGMVVGRAIVRDRFHGAEAQRVMAQVSLTFALAPAIAPVLGGWLHVWWGWRSVFAFLVLFAGATWVLCYGMLPETLPREKRQPLNPSYLARSYWRVLTSVQFMAVCFSLTLMFLGFFIYVVSAPVFLMQHLNVGETGFLWLFGPITAGMACGSILAGRLAGRITPRRTAVWSIGIMALATLANVALSFLAAPALPWSVAPLFFYVLGMSSLFPTLTIRALDLFPTQRGLAASCQSFVQTSGAAINAVIAPLVWGSVQSLATVQVIAIVLGIVMLLIHIRTKRHPGPPSEITSDPLVQPVP